MSKADTARSIMFAIVAMGIVFSVSGLVVGQSMQTADATHPRHRHHNDENDNNGNNPAAASSPAASSSNGNGDDIGVASGSGIGSFGSDVAALQLTTTQAASSNAA
ncbi:MAG: hypothetical protein WBL68_17650, partial [Nitrososphaeraceae archaeon]